MTSTPPTAPSEDTMQWLNHANQTEAMDWLHGIYEHSPWVGQAALQHKPFRSLAHLKWALANSVTHATHAQQLALVKAHPVLAAKPASGLTAESQQEQQLAGLWQSTPAQAKELKQLNDNYVKHFGWPFIIAVRGPRGLGLSPDAILAELRRRMSHSPAIEFHECLRQIHRIAETRLNEKCQRQPQLGGEVWDWHEWLAQFSDPGFGELGQLSVSYLTPAHVSCANTLRLGMLACGFDEVDIDGVGNVVGRYHPETLNAPYLLTGSHYDTVRNGGKYDGRLGIFVPMACVRELARTGKRLRIGLEVVAFAEEEGQRYKATFLASSALTGEFDPRWLEQQDAQGVRMKDAMQQAGHRVADIGRIRRDPSQYLGFVEVHIEQGPVLHHMHLPLAIVTSINGSVRYVVKITGTASHAGTSPMNQRQDAVAAFAQWAVYAEQRARQDGDSVATVGMLNVPQGSINVVPGACHFSLDMRAPNDAQRDALAHDILQCLRDICSERGVQCEWEETVRAAAAPSDAGLQSRWEQAVAGLGLPIHRMPSGAGHDAMKMHQMMPQAMLFVRGENQGISHNPLECTTADDIQLSINALASFIHHMSQEV
jgi:beta-ureidopropionase / N-carbamoyl-L-amino-acid hydrolase